MSLLAVTFKSLSSSMIQPSSAWPDLTPSTTTTPTPSPSSCTTKWIMTLFYSHGRPSPLPDFARRTRGGAGIGAVRSAFSAGGGFRISNFLRHGSVDPPGRGLAGAMGGGLRRVDEDH